MDKVLCPWCGSEMEYIDVLVIGSNERSEYYYECPECEARSPLANSEEEALNAAIRRPLQKPLTLEEAVREKAVWVEFSDGLEEYEKDDGIAAVIFESYCHVDNQCVLVGDDLEDTIHDGLWLDDRDYNDSWRCWATKPTQEEREAAKWEEL